MFLWQKRLWLVSLSTWEGNISAVGEVFQLTISSSSHLSQLTGNFHVLASHKTCNASSWEQRDCWERATLVEGQPLLEVSHRPRAGAVTLAVGPWCRQRGELWPFLLAGCLQHLGFGLLGTSAALLLVAWCGISLESCMRTAWEFIRITSNLKHVTGEKSVLSCEVILAVDFFFFLGTKVALQ